MHRQKTKTAQEYFPEPCVIPDKKVHHTIIFLLRKVEERPNYSDLQLSAFLLVGKVYRYLLP